MNGHIKQKQKTFGQTANFSTIVITTKCLDRPQMTLRGLLFGQLPIFHSLAFFASFGGGGAYTQKKKETEEIFRAHNKKGKPGEFDTHMTLRGKGRQLEWIAKTGGGKSDNTK